MNYTKETVAFMASWQITPEQNNVMLEKFNTGELVQIKVGCDTGIVRTMNCYTAHKKYHVNGISGWVTRCKVCQMAFQNIEIQKLYEPNMKEIIDVADAKIVAAELVKAIKQIDAETQMQNRQKAEQEAERKAEQGARTIVHVQKNLETGLWRILGGEHGRLERDVFFKARDEMRTAFQGAVRGNTQLLASAIQPVSKGKHFDLITENFAFQIVAEVME